MTQNEKVVVMLKISKKALEQLAWLTLNIFNDVELMSTVVERAIDDMYVALVKEL